MTARFWQRGFLLPGSLRRGGVRPTLPRPGLASGRYPQRAEAEPEQARWRDLAATALQQANPWWPAATLARHRATLARLRCASADVPLRELRAALAREGLPPARWAGWSGPAAPAAPALVQACAVVDHAARMALGLVPHDGQWLAALAMLEGGLAELPTGEGKTLAMALAASVGALAGWPVQALTANDYLVQRDAQAMAPLYDALGLRCAAVLPGQDDAARRAAWAADVAYATGHELVFDYLRDGLAGAGAASHPLQEHARRLQGVPEPAAARLRGLGLVLLDEADSLLLDEALMPLVLSQNLRDPQRQALLWRAIRQARTLAAGTHWTPGEAPFEVQLTDAGREQLDRDSRTWPSPRERDEWVARALGALHRVQRERDYLVRDAQVHIIDSVTGRLAEGRVWAQGLHTLVALKEGLPAPQETRTLAQISYQRFFPRCLRLGGMSGTLTEARRELAQAYGLAVLPVPPARPSRLQRLPSQVFGSAAARWAAVALRCAALSAAGRPVLVGTDSVADSEALAAVLAAAGLAAAVLNARQDAQEAAVVAAAGQAGRITVATRMAGRGTDIVLGPGVAAAGGLHVINCQCNPSGRQDRQLAGRAARQGQPGSHEHWHVLGADAQADRLSRLSSRLATRVGTHNAPRVLHWVALALVWMQGMRRQQHERAQRLALARQDRERQQRLRFADPLS